MLSGLFLSNEYAILARETKYRFIEVSATTKTEGVALAMPEHKPPQTAIPLRVRFRSPSASAHWERDSPHIPTPSNGHPPSSPSVASTPPAQSSESPRVTRQIKELIRLGNLLGAELGLNEVLQQIADSINGCIGFRSSVINLVEEGHDYLSPVAFAGISEEDMRILSESRLTVDQLHRLMRKEFRISQSYFIPHEYLSTFSDIVWVVDKTVDDYEPGGWHPEDALFVPLFGPRRKKLLGLLSLDDPVDGKIPTLETIEVAELFANQAAIAIDNARAFQERETERLALEEGIALLSHDLEQIQHGDLRLCVQTSHEKLRPIGDAINTMVEGISSIFRDAQMVTRAVDEHTRDVQHSSELLMRDADQQSRHVQHISHVIDEMALPVKLMAGRATELATVAMEAMDVTNEGQSAVDRAVDGMGLVREATMYSARIMKRLGESGQEINEMAVVINDLTTRLNLLALNAAVEAARVGEQGQGFAVIASELRKLAVQSAETARNATTHIHTIQHETTSVSKSIEQSTQQVVNQTELVTQTSVALEAITVVTEQMMNLVGGICTAAESQTHGSQLVVGSIEDIKRMTGEITEQMRQMQQSLDKLVGLTNSLRSRMAAFRVSE